MLQDHTDKFLLMSVQWFKINKELQEEEVMMSTLFLIEDEALMRVYNENILNAYLI